ncbi:MAG: hypothetical protein QOK01_1609 [Alphaproteobacteria bacterium]|nr:hypothetical protein [Alphaproteobacteria bacterium]
MDAAPRGQAVWRRAAARRPARHNQRRSRGGPAGVGRRAVTLFLRGRGFGIRRHGRRRLPAPQGTEDRDRASLLEFRSRLDLVLGQLDGDDVLLAIVAQEFEHRPIDRDLAAADAQESAEIDDGRARLAVAIDHHVDEAAHVLAGDAAHALAENGLRVAGVEHDGRRRRLYGGNRNLGRDVGRRGLSLGRVRGRLRGLRRSRRHRGRNFRGRRNLRQRRRRANRGWGLRRERHARVIAGVAHGRRHGDGEHRCGRGRPSRMPAHVASRKELDDEVNPACAREVPVGSRRALPVCPAATSAGVSGCSSEDGLCPLPDR